MNPFYPGSMENSSVDILCFGAHPDDVELAMAGTVIKHVNQGLKVGIVDLTKGELGSRGDEHTRKEEATDAAKIMGLTVRENLGLPDGFISNTQEALLKVVESIRAYQPKVIFCNAPSDRHPDHGAGSELLKKACFLSGLIKIETSRNGEKQAPHRPKQVFNYIQDFYHEPDFVVDVTDVYDKRMAAIQAYKTQFFSKEQTGPQTPISSPEFLEFLNGRAAEFGRRIGARYGEGFIAEQPLAVSNAMDLIL